MHILHDFPLTAHPRQHDAHSIENTCMSAAVVKNIYSRASQRKNE